MEKTRGGCSFCGKIIHGGWCSPIITNGLRNGVIRQAHTAPKIKNKQQNTCGKPRGNSIFAGYTPVDMQNIRNIAFHLKIISGRIPLQQPQPQPLPQPQLQPIPFHVVVIPEHEIPPLCAAVVPTNQSMDTVNYMFCC